MQTAKQVLPYGSSTLIGTVVEMARRSVVDDVVVVTGFHRAEVEAAVGDGARIVYNPDAAAGNMSSLVTGIGAISEAAGVVVLLSDMPQVSVDTINALVSGVVAAGSSAGWVAYADGNGHPIVLTPSTLRTVQSLVGRKALWSYLESIDSDSLFVLVCDSVRPIDVNTEDDYRDVIRDLQAGATPPS